MTPNHQYFIFSHRDDVSKSWDLLVKQISDESYFQITTDNFNDRRAKFSPNGNRLIYHHYTPKVNQIIIADID